MTRQRIPIGEAPLFEILTIVTLFLVAVLGVIIAYQAYRGYRRNDSTSMLYLAVGLLLLTLFPFLANIVLNTLWAPERVTVVFVQNTFRLAGLVSIMYSLYGQH